MDKKPITSQMDKKLIAALAVSLVLLGAGIYMFFQYQSANAEVESLNSQIALLSAQAANLSSERASMAERLNTAVEKLSEQESVSAKTAAELDNFKTVMRRFIAISKTSVSDVETISITITRSTEEFDELGYVPASTVEKYSDQLDVIREHDDEYKAFLQENSELLEDLKFDIGAEEKKIDKGLDALETLLDDMYSVSQ